MAPDAKKHLSVLASEWESCTKCSLGDRREKTGGAFVFGEGAPRSIMFVGEGPGRVEEAEGRPFVGPSGQLLRGVLAKLGVTEFYLTNCVSCRSCSPVTNPDGTPMIRKYNGREQGLLYRDEPPTPPQVLACRPRLLEEVYIVDPVVIVALGAQAATALAQENIAITSERGKERTIEIPGAAYRASLTEKRGVWMRKSGGQITYPVVQNTVKYLMIPTLHPAFIMRKLADRGQNSPFRLFVNDLRAAARTYERYLLEAFGVEPTGSSDVSDEEVMRNDINEEEANNYE